MINLGKAKFRKVRLGDILTEVTAGVGERWREFPLIGATRAGLAPAKEAIGKYPGRYKPVMQGQIFYNPMRILLGSIAMVGEGDSPGITSPDYVVIKCVEGKLHPLWFYHWFRSTDGSEFIKTLTRGAVRERLLFNRLANGELNIPAWETQVTFAAQYREIRNIHAALAVQQKYAEALPAACLRVAFQSSITQHWPVRRLGDIGEIVGGIQKRPDRAPINYHKAFLTVRNVQRGYLDLSRVERFEVTDTEFERYRLRRDDLLIVEGNGSIDHIGRNALFREDGEWIHQNHIIRVRLPSSPLLPEFVAYYLRL